MFFLNYFSFLASHIKKRSHTNGWTETDLDASNISRNMSNHSISSDISNHGSNSGKHSGSYNIETGSANSNVSIQMNDNRNNRYDSYRQQQQESDGIESSGMESDDLLEDSNFANLTNQEKQEIKTVRIVKRESQQRQRDREKNGVSFSSQNMDQIMEERSRPITTNDEYDPYSRSKSLPKNYIDHETYNPEPLTNINGPTNYSDYYNNLVNHQYPVSMTDYNNHQQVIEPPKYSTVNKQPKSISQQQQQSEPPQQSSGLKNKTESIQSLTKVVGDLSPVFQSEAARQIMIEMAGNTSEENNEKVPNANKQRRAVPREKRRHYTAPHHVNAKSIQSMQAENDMNRNVRNFNLIY